MTKSAKPDLEQEVVLRAREYGISTVLFRNAVGSKLGVNVTDMECLALLFFKGISTPSELSRHTGLSSGATTAMLDRLEKAHLITRKPNPNDRRGVIISVEPKSKKTVGPMFATAREAQNKLLASYSEKDLELMADFFSKYTDVWEQARKELIHNT
jgi:DNA-binding MarR family transcriptional regulator